MKKLTYPLILISLAAALTSCATDQTQESYSLARYNFQQQNYDLAFQQVQAPAQAGNADAEYALGYMYYYGKGTPTDQEQGKVWISKAAQDGSKDAEDALKIILNQEQDIPTKVSDNVVSSPVVTPAPSSTTELSSSDNTTVATSPTTSTSSTSTAVSQAPTKAVVIAPAAATSSTAAYTIQLVVTSSQAQADAFIKQHKLGKNASVHQRSVNKRLFYVVTYGQFETKEAATAALHTLPKSVESLHPWVRTE